MRNVLSIVGFILLVVVLYITLSPVVSADRKAPQPYYKNREMTPFRDFEVGLVDRKISASSPGVEIKRTGLTMAGPVNKVDKTFVGMQYNRVVKPQATTKEATSTTWSVQSSVQKNDLQRFHVP